MAYSKDDFQEWIFCISDKMDYLTNEFAEEHKLSLDLSIKSLDELEEWIIDNFSTIDDLRNNQKILDLLTVYIGQTFQKHIGGKWYMDLENKDNAYYHMPILTNPDYKGVKHKSPRTYAIASVDRRRGNHISTILKNCMEDMGILS